MTIRLTRRNDFTGKYNTMDLPLTKEEWEHGKAQSWKLNPGIGTKHIQDCFPQLNAGQREFLISGITPEEWDEMFGSEE